MPEKKRVWYGSRGPFFVDESKTYPDGATHSAVHIEGVQGDAFLRDYTAYFQFTMPEGRVLAQIGRRVKHERFMFKCTNQVSVTFEIYTDENNLQETIVIEDKKNHIETIDVEVPEGVRSSIVASYTGPAPEEAVISLLGRLV